MTQLNAKAVGDSNVLQLDDTRYARLGWLLMLPKWSVIVAVR